MGKFPVAAAAALDNLYTDMDTIIRILAEDPKPSVTTKGLYQGKSAPGEEQVYPLSGSFNVEITSEYGCPPLENNMRLCGLSLESAEETGSLYTDHADLDLNTPCLDNKQEKDDLQMGDQTSFPSNAEESLLEVNNNPCFLARRMEKEKSHDQPRSLWTLFLRLLREWSLISDSSHNMVLETSGCSAVMDVDMNDTSMPHTIVQENHSGALSMSSSVVPDILLPDTICTETNPRDPSDIFCNASNTSLKLWRGYTSGAEIASRHTLHGDPFLLREKDSMVHKSNGRVVQQFPFKNSCLTCTLDGSLSTTIPMVPAIDFYVSLPGFLCSEQSHCGYTTFKRESSTDFSASSSRNFTSNSIDRFAVNIAEQMVSDFKTFLPNKKQKVLLEDKWKGQIPAPCYQQSENSLCNDAVRRSLSRSSSSVDDDADIPKLDDISVPVGLTLSHMKLMSQQYGLSDSYLHGSGGTRLKADDERLTFQIALQDLSQPTSEATPPDGLLAVPLLRH